MASGRGVSRWSLHLKKGLKSQTERAKQTRKTTSGATVREMKQYVINEKEFHDLSSIIKPDSAKKAALVHFPSTGRETYRALLGLVKRWKMR